jgi:hypothetical protein
METEQELERQLTTLEKTDAEISNEQFSIGAKIRATDLKTAKDKLAKQKGELYAKGQQVKDQINKLREALCIPKLEAMLTENRYDILLYVNGDRIRVPDNLAVEIRFSCRKHSLKMPLYELIRVQTNMPNNQTLLAHWTSIINGKETRTRQLMCEQCMTEKREYAKKHHITSKQRTGIALIKIQVV